MRLNSIIRNFVFNGVMEHRLKPLDDKLAKLKKEIGDELFDANFERPPIPEGVSEALFDDWIGKIDSVRVKLELGSVAHEDTLSYPKVRTDEYFKRLEFPLSRRRFVPRVRLYESGVPLSVAKNSRKFKEFLSTLEKAAMLRAEIREKVWPILLGPTTVAALLRVWPECKPFLPPELPKTRGLVPVDAVRKVNRLVDLPVEEK